MRILLTGGNGFVAGSIIRQCPDDTELHVFSRAPMALRQPNVRCHQYSGYTREEWTRWVREVQPRAILHMAAIAAIDYAQAHQNEAVQVNTTFPAVLAEVAREEGVRLVHASTDNVFDGKQGMYVESDTPASVNFYGETKVAAEQAVRDAGGNHVIARISIVYGMPVLGAGNSFLAQMLPKLERGETVGVPENEIRSAIDVATLGAALLELARNDFQGILHLGGNDVLNRVQLVRRLAKHQGLNPDLVVPNDPTQIPGRAPRPLDVSLNNALARSVLQTPFPDTEEGLARNLALLS